MILTHGSNSIGSGGGIPEGYTEVNSITSSGTNPNICFNIPLVNAKKIICNFFGGQNLGFSGSECAVFSINSLPNTSSDRYIYLRFIGIYSTAQRAVILNGNNQVLDWITAFDLKGNHEFILDGGQLIIDGVNSIATDYVPQTLNYLYPAGYYAGSFNQEWGVKRLQIFDNTDKLLIDLKAVKRTSDGILGFWDNNYGFLGSSNYIEISA